MLMNLFRSIGICRRTKSTLAAVAYWLEFFGWLCYITFHQNFFVGFIVLLFVSRSGGLSNRSLTVSSRLFYVVLLFIMFVDGNWKLDVNGPNIDDVQAVFLSVHCQISYRFELGHIYAFASIASRESQKRSFK